LIGRKNFERSKSGERISVALRSFFMVLMFLKLQTAIGVDLHSP